MISLWQIYLALLIIFVSYFVRKWLQIWDVRRKLESWMPSAPRVPILGAITSIGDSTESISDFARLTNNAQKTCYIEIAGKSEIATRDYDLVEFVLTSNTILTKSIEYSYFLPWLGTGLFTAAGQKWKNHRKALVPAFHFSILEQFVEVFDSSENIMISKLKSEALGKDSIDIYKYVTACALDILCETAMGVNIGAQNNQNQDYINAVQEMCRIVMSRTFSLWRNNEQLFKLTSDYRKQTEILKTLHGFTNAVINKRREELKSKQECITSKNEDDLGIKRRRAFLDLLLSSNVGGKPLADEEIREEVDTFMFAGHDTTSSSISSAFYVLASHPEIQEKVRDELKAIFGKDRDRKITYQDLQNMKYLDLVVKEVLRLYPPAPMVSRNTEEDVKYKDHIIPKNTIITLFIYGINRDPDFYDEPEVFEPERFLETDRRKPFSYIPFSAGPRNCIGQKFAVLEMKSMVAKVLMHFKVLPTNPPHKMLLSQEVVLKSLNGVLLRLQECDWQT